MYVTAIVRLGSLTWCDFHRIASEGMWVPLRPEMPIAPHSKEPG
jgi:hypothetical protein